MDNTKVDFEVLLVKDNEENKAVYNVIGTTYSNALAVDTTAQVLPASYMTIQKVKELLREGKIVMVPKVTDFPEIVIGDLIIREADDSVMSIKKRALINEIAARMHQTIIGVSVIDSMDFLTSYMKLLNYGIFITDENREDKYYEIFEEAQDCEKPDPLSDNATFEEEDEYSKKMEKYNIAQGKLDTLQTYLNAYDKLAKIKYISDLLSKSKERVESAQTDKELGDAMDYYKHKLSLFDSSPNV